MPEPDRCNLTVIPENDWHPDAANQECELCNTKFTFTRRRHHCRFCGRVVCDACSKNRCNSHRICNVCFYNVGDCITLESVRGKIHNFLLVGIVEKDNYIYYVVTKNGVGENFIQHNKKTRGISFTMGIGEDDVSTYPDTSMNNNYKKIMKKGPSGIFDKLLKTSILFDSRTNECIMGGKRFRKYDSITFYAEGSNTDVQSSPFSPYETLKYNVTALVKDIIPSDFSTNTPTQVVLEVTSGNIVMYLSDTGGTYTSPISADSTIVLQNSKMDVDSINYGDIILKGDLKCDNIRVIRVDIVIKSKERQAGGNKHRKNKNKKSKRVVKRYISKRYKNRRNKVTKRSKRSKKLRRR